MLVVVNLQCLSNHKDNSGLIRYSVTMVSNTAVGVLLFRGNMVHFWFIDGTLETVVASLAGRVLLCRQSWFKRILFYITQRPQGRKLRSNCNYILIPIIYVVL